MDWPPDEPITDHPKLPDGVPLLADFHDDRNRVSHWFPRVAELDHDLIRQPHTAYFDLRIEDGTPVFDDMAIAHWMRENGYQHAFVRSDFTSAKVHPRRGTHIHEPEGDVVRETVGTMIGDIVHGDRRTGGRLVVREWLDLDYCLTPAHSHLHFTEVRYFIRDGRVIYHTPSVEEWFDAHESCAYTYDYVMDGIGTSDAFPSTQAAAVASEFDEYAWHADFARVVDPSIEAEHERWYLIDMGLDGLHWIDFAEQWHEIAEHDPASDYAVQPHSDAVPDPESL